MKLFGHEIGPGHPCPIIADIGLCHDGDGQRAIALMKAAKGAGADIAKFQKRTVDLLAIPAVLDAPVNDPRFPGYTGTYRQLREEHEFDGEFYVLLQAAASMLDLGFLVTPFDIPSVDLLQVLGVSAYKIASHSVTNLPLIKHIARTRKPIIMSTGMCTLDELDEAVKAARYYDSPLALLHCVSAYPTRPADVNLSMMGVLRARYGTPVGYSGHEEGYIPSVMALLSGADILERHITLEKTPLGFDHLLALTPDEFVDMLAAATAAAECRGDGVKRITVEERAVRDKYRPSIAAKQDIAAGQTITEDMLYLTNPGTGLHPREIGRIIGRKAARAVRAGTLIEWADIQ